MPEGRDRSFAAKVACFNAGYEQLQGLEYDVIGNLDADITFDEGYFEFLIDKFMQNIGLGVIGTPFVEGAGHYATDLRALNTFPVPASYSGASVLKKLGVICR